MEATRQKLSDTKIQLESELIHLEELSQTEKAREQIALIAANIFRKNLKIVLEYETTKKCVTHLFQKLQEAKKRFNVFDKGYRRVKQNHVYQVITTNDNSTKTSALKENELTAIIADALMVEPYAVQLVARSTGNNLEWIRFGS